MSEEQKIKKKCIEIEEAQIQFKRKNKVQMIDVRTIKEYTEQPIEMSINIPLNTIENTIQTIPKNKTIITICNKGGRRSAQAAQ